MSTPAETRTRALTLRLEEEMARTLEMFAQASGISLTEQIREAITGVPAENIARFERIGLAASALAAPVAGFAGQEAYPEFWSDRDPDATDTVIRGVAAGTVSQEELRDWIAERVEGGR